MAPYELNSCYPETDANKVSSVKRVSAKYFKIY